MKPALAGTAAALLLVTGCGTSQAATDTPAPAVQPPGDAKALFDRWNTSLAAGDLDGVVDQYAADAVLLPTVAGEVHDTRAEITEYFEHFLELRPSGTLVEPKTRALGPDAVVLSGLYDFAVTADGEPDTVQARMTFVFERRDGRWTIVEHHSSRKP
ncbi:SgcJ/EcaC family oxidoreductase [Actinosynnema mirum]|uniref:Calcium/calmodulin dependent protein kinase II association-domain protein n=1 Tax=Actinosynnema mirum (strain ATCC 29888 / DSM 43827 / JCM 3225 / NBRC 14064 / NCIMB 13271 / NRRL B-12336 / IMRU 3971 / 101) TaxID=446462 RepID=C6WH72_ACTMD|nr:SgcJ/EcaC family oxidoreductase [Actinosynnema mirum]ACU37991.1 Calcium/calmodulin dependent protein kinase II association-domain protein [Actinosynnema mirum DSM 43827]